MGEWPAPNSTYLFFSKAVKISAPLQRLRLSVYNSSTQFPSKASSNPMKKTASRKVQQSYSVYHPFVCVCVWVCVCYWTWANRFDEKSGYYVIVGTRSTTKRALTTPINPPPAMAPLATLKNKWKRLLCELCCNHTHEDRMTNPQAYLLQYLSFNMRQSKTTNEPNASIRLWLG